MFSTFPSLRLPRRLQSLYGGIKRLPVNSSEALLSLYFSYCNLSPCTVDLDDRETTMHMLVPNHHRCDKPNLVLVHGYGGNSKWQFVLQVAQLSRDFNIYIPDLVFFGKSYSTSSERTDTFQAKCVCDGMKKLGVEKYSVYGISYGGFVVYRMAEMAEKTVEKVVVVNSAIVFTEDKKSEYLKKFGRNVVDVLVPEKPEEYRTLCRMSMYKFDVSKWIPDFFLRGFIAADGYKKEKIELVEYLLMEKPHLQFPVLTQETLIIWGEKDNIFPVDLAHELHRHLGPKSKLEILKDVGHAANMEAPYSLNKLVTMFVSTGYC
ncbi:Alpha/beta hydrolase fold-1 [Artemisia annua]|uniref:Alpha/beta hydrolase fold-1 n=1 Tax=Artemisia annua TaxID=35608 RepID=A0A2U1P5B8_ARTAN|nr:Alpha/beta hydrolase fold-1 [Artemisia annua]